MTKAKMRGRQWSMEAAPQMGSAGSIPVASPSPPYSSENQFTAPTGAGGGTSTPKSHLSRREGAARPQVSSPTPQLF